MNFEKQMKKHIDATLDALVPNPYQRKRSFPTWAKIALPIGGLALASALALAFFLPNALRQESLPYNESTPGSTSATGDPASFFFSIPERFTLGEVTYQSVFSSDLGRIDIEKAGESAKLSKPYGAIVKPGYEADFEKNNPGMPYFVSSSQYYPRETFIYLCEVEGYSPLEVLCPEAVTTLYVAFRLEVPEQFTLSGKTYESTHSTDLGVLDKTRKGESARPEKRYGAMVKEGYEKQFEADYPNLPYFIESSDKFSEKLNFDLVFSVLGFDAKEALYFEGALYKVI